MKKPLVVLCVLVCSTLSLSAQIDEAAFRKEMEARMNEYKTLRTELRKEYEEYRKQLNAEYAQYMRRAWTEYKPCPSKPVPPRKEPPKPVVKTPEPDTKPIPNTIPLVVPKVEPKVEPIVEPEDSVAEEPAEVPVIEPVVEPAEPQEEPEPPMVEPEPDILPFDEVVPPAEPAPPVEPVVPLPEVEPVVPSVPGHEFDYYGTACKIAGMNSTHRFALKGVKEEHVADAWELLADDKYLAILAQCADYREKLNLCDWGYVRFLQEMTESFFTASRSNEAVLMQIYLLVQSGYRVRMARCNDRLVLLLPIEHDVYDYSYLTVDSTPYYIIDKQSRGQSFYVYDRAFAKETALSLYMSSPPSLSAADARVVERTLKSEYGASVLTFTIKTDRNLIDFYNDYPVSSQWHYYANVSLSEETKSNLYPLFTTCFLLEGMSKTDAANLLLNFVQTAFDYKTDQEQFGYERPLFGDEALYYPYCDCEDRSILYSILVRDLLGLDVVLLNYPGHLATAVKFNEEVRGDYIMLDDGKYVVCDPTYIGASIGDAMPDCRNEKAVIVRI